MDIGIITGYICCILALMCMINLQKFQRINPIPLEYQRRYIKEDDSDGHHSSDADDEGAAAEVEFDVPRI